MKTIFLCICLLLAACGNSAATPDEAQSTTAPTRALIQYQSPTPTLDQTVTPPPIQPTVPALPTATPFLYTVVDQDTLIGIAVKFNVSLEDLLAANPEVDPRALSIDTVLVIPTGEGEVVSLPTPTPVPVSFSEPACYLNTAGGLWCLVVTQNNAPNALENLSANIYLYSEAGEVLDSQVATAPLNVFGSNQRLALAAYFSPPLPAWRFAQAQLLTALPVPDADDRYLPVAISDLEIAILQDSVTAEISGDVHLTGGERSANIIWVAAVAYAEDDRVVGFRRWEATNELPPESSLNFAFEVYSLDAPIAQVEVYAEARP
ncbi:MAG: LysM peptidoglycan-binding domain-containing protein [Anaerolineales bacterium]|nr:LysM peptidoglycan-binding domain-containing protein [Anaerolineales bacterium]